MLFLLLLACSPTATSTRGCSAPPATSSVVEVVEETEVAVAKVTAYTADCKGCSGITRDGTVAESHKRILAADPRYYPLGTRVELTFPDGDVEVYTVRDTGGAIKGKGRFDMLVRTERFAVEWGVQHIKYRVLSTK
jgi:3D (Asp-Asp-Asp) domain-containing protein